MHQLIFNFVKFHERKVFAEQVCSSDKQWKGINRTQSTRWQHLSWLKASAFFSLQKNCSCYETQQLILGTGTAIWGQCYKTLPR